MMGERTSLPRSVTGRSYSSHLCTNRRTLTIGYNGPAIRDDTMDLIVLLLCILVGGGSGGGGN